MGINTCIGYISVGMVGLGAVVILLSSVVVTGVAAADSPKIPTKYLVKGVATNITVELPEKAKLVAAIKVGDDAIYLEASLATNIHTVKTFDTFTSTLLSRSTHMQKGPTFVFEITVPAASAFKSDSMKVELSDSSVVEEELLKLQAFELVLSPKETEPGENQKVWCNFTNPADNKIVGDDLRLRWTSPPSSRWKVNTDMALKDDAAQVSLDTNDDARFPSFSAGAFMCDLLKGDEVLGGTSFLRKADINTKWNPSCKEPDNCLADQPCEVICAMRGYPLAVAVIIREKNGEVAKDCDDKKGQCILSFERVQHSDAGKYLMRNCQEKGEDKVCVEREFKVRVKSANAAIWPAIGIVLEIVILAICIYFCEQHRTRVVKQEMEEEEKQALIEQRKEKTEAIRKRQSAARA